MSEQGQPEQCEGSAECKDPPGEDGYCNEHRPNNPRKGRKLFRMTCAELREHGVEVVLDGGSNVIPLTGNKERDLERLQDQNGSFLDTLGNGGR